MALRVMALPEVLDHGAPYTAIAGAHRTPTQIARGPALEELNDGQGFTHLARVVTAISARDAQLAVLV